MKVKPGNGLICHVFLPNVTCVSNYQRGKSDQPFSNMTFITLTDGTSLLVEGAADDITKSLQQEYERMHNHG